MNPSGSGGLVLTKRRGERVICGYGEIKKTEQMNLWKRGIC